MLTTHALTHMGDLEEDDETRERFLREARSAVV